MTHFIFKINLRKESATEMVKHYSTHI